MVRLTHVRAARLCGVGLSAGLLFWGAAAPCASLLPDEAVCDEGCEAVALPAPGIDTRERDTQALPPRIEPQDFLGDLDRQAPWDGGAAEPPPR